MKTRIIIRHVGQFLLFGVVATLIFYLVYQGQDWKVIYRDIRDSSIEWIAASVGISLIGNYARGWRWAIMLHPLGYRVSPLRAFLSVMVGYLVNIPTARLGEVARCIILKKMTHVPIETSLGAIVAERIIDLVMLATLAILTILLEFDKIGSFVLKNLQQAAHFSINSNVIVATAFFIAFTLLLAWRFRKKLCHHPFTHKMLKIVYGLKNGFLAIRKLSFRQRVLFLFFTALIWVCYFLMSYFLFFSRPDTSFLGLRCALAVLVMSGLGVTLPTPGGIGSYHLFVSFTLTAYGLNEKIAKSFAFLMHSSQLITIVIVGFFALAISSFLSAEKKVSSLVV